MIVAKLSGSISGGLEILNENLKVKTAALTPSGEWLYTVLQVWPTLLY